MCRLPLHVALLLLVIVAAAHAGTPGKNVDVTLHAKFAPVPVLVEAR